MNTTSASEGEPPSVYDEAELTSDRFQFWLSMDGWSEDEAAHLLCAIDPRARDNWARVFGGRLELRYPYVFDPIHSLVKRAGEAGSLKFPATPLDVMRWAEAKRLKMPKVMLDHLADNQLQKARLMAGPNGLRMVPEADFAGGRPIDWDTWKARPTVRTWEAVYLSLGLSPPVLPDYIQAGEDWQFDDRKDLLDSHLAGDAGEPLGLRGDIESRTARIKLPAFGSWAVAMGWTIPNELPRIEQASKDRPAAGPWPWGSYSNDRLEALQAAVREFWNDFEPSTDRTRAATNGEVAAWLKEHFGFTGNQADAIAQIIRPSDKDLPTGARPSRKV